MGYIVTELLKQNNTAQMKRREFIRQTSGAAAGLGLAGILPLEMIAAQRKRISPNDKLGLAVIGCNGMGWTNMSRHFQVDGVECVALCDVDQSVLDRRAAETEKIQGKKPKLYGDYRKLLDNKDVDAVIIGTPDHWHCLIMVDAVKAGKHVYVEKPIANTIEECRIMVDAAKKYNKVVQVGQWQRSGGHYGKAIDYVHSGKLGNIRLVKVWAYQGWMKPVPVVPDGPPPEGVDYVIPGNDDASRAIALYCDLVARAALDGMSAQLGAAGVDLGALEVTPEEEALATNEAEA